MRISDSVANYILQMLNDENGIAEIPFHTGAGIYRREQARRRRLHSHHSPEHDKIRFNHAHCQFHRA